MKFEAVRRVPVCHLGLEVRREVDDIDGVEWTFLWTDTTPNA